MAELSGQGSLISENSDVVLEALVWDPFAFFERFGASLALGSPKGGLVSLPAEDLLSKSHSMWLDFSWRRAASLLRTLETE